jgi:hypothetical protein
MTRCLRCGQMLSSRQERYCSNACKQADYRDRIPFNRLADQALAVLRPPAKSLVAGGIMDPGFDWRDRVAYIKTYYPAVWSTFGEDVLDASARPMPAAACRWCWAFATARVGNRKSVLTRAMVSTAARKLLGEPCGNCRKRAFATLKRHVDAGRPKKTSGDATRGVGRLTNVPRGTQSAGSLTSSAGTLASPEARVASPDSRKRLHDPLGTCSVCRNYRRSHPAETLTAGGIPHGCPPHAWNEQPRARRAWMR